MNKETQERIKNILISLSNNKCLGCKKFFDCDNKKVDCKEYEKIKPFKHCYTCVYSTIANRLGNCYCDIRHKDYHQTSLLADSCKYFKRASDEKKLCTERCESFYSKKYCTGKDKEPCKFLRKTVGGFDDFGDEKATELRETPQEEERTAVSRAYKMVEKKTKRR